jgi:hypothetical protein
MTNAASASTTDGIRTLNDNFRTTFRGGRVLMTPGVSELPAETRTAILSAVRSFDKFDADNDPHREHDFGSFEIEGETYFWKIDYYAPDLRSGAENPALPETSRVLTIMRADEY